MAVAASNRLKGAYRKYCRKYSKLWGSGYIKPLGWRYDKYKMEDYKEIIVRMTPEMKHNAKQAAKLIGGLTLSSYVRQLLQNDVIRLEQLSRSRGKPWYTYQQKLQDDKAAARRAKEKRLSELNELWYQALLRWRAAGEGREIYGFDSNVECPEVARELEALKKELGK